MREIFRESVRLILPEDNQGGNATDLNEGVGKATFGESFSLILRQKRLFIRQMGFGVGCCAPGS